jgi:hypothetical protein
VIESQTPPSINGSISGNRIITNQSTTSKSASSYVCVFKLDKTALTQRSLSVDDIVNALRLFVGEEAHVISSKRWCKDWLVSIRPPAFGKQGDMDRCITEAVHDSLLESAIVNGLHGVTKAIASYDSQIKKWVVDTDGSDVVSANRLSGIDKQFTWTNNIIDTGKCFGVEAAVALQQVELHRVLSFDGSYVDPRHTWLLSDAVTRSGTTNPLNRHKMEELGGSLLQCASFEQTLDVFGVGAAFGSSDNLSGATEKLIVGQPVHVGTGSFEILLDSNSISKETSTFVGPLFDKSNSKMLTNSEYVTPLLFDSNYTEMECEVLPINFNNNFVTQIETDNELIVNEIEMDDIQDSLFVEPLMIKSNEAVQSLHIQMQTTQLSKEKESREYIPPRLITTNDLVSPLSYFNGNVNSTNTNIFSSQSFSSSEISEFAKELLPIMEIMQKSATNRRSIFLKAIIGSTSLSRQTLLNFEMNLEKYYNWSHTESWTQTTRVYYNNSFTDVIFKNKSMYPQTGSIYPRIGYRIT